MAKLLHTLSQSGTRESLKKKFTSKFLSEERSGTFIDSVALVAPGLLQTLVHLAPPRATPGWDGLRARAQVAVYTGDRGVTLTSPPRTRLLHPTSYQPKVTDSRGRSAQAVLNCANVPT